MVYLVGVRALAFKETGVLGWRTLPHAELGRRLQVTRTYPFLGNRNVSLPLVEGKGVSRFLGEYAEDHRRRQTCKTGKVNFWERVEAFQLLAVSVTVGKQMNRPCAMVQFHCRAVGGRRGPTLLYVLAVSVG